MVLSRWRTWTLTLRFDLLFSFVLLHGMDCCPLRAETFHLLLRHPVLLRNGALCTPSACAPSCCVGSKT